MRTMILAVALCAAWAGGCDDYASAQTTTPAVPVLPPWQHPSTPHTHPGWSHGPVTTPAWRYPYRAPWYRYPYSYPYYAYPYYDPWAAPVYYPYSYNYGFTTPGFSIYVR